MKPQALFLRNVLVLTLSVSFLGGCVTGGEVFRTTDKMLQQLKDFEAAGYICAPVEYANARANAEFARTESDHGDTLKAKAHLDQAQDWYQKAWAATHHPDNSLREGCEPDDDDDGVLNSRDRCREEA